MSLSCLRCGECCKREPGCLYGRGTPCEHLVMVDGVYACNEVLTAENREDIEIDLGIGDGCIQPPLRRESVIDERIEAWHQGDSPLPLHEYLGWTWEQYARWVETGEFR